MEYLNLNVSYKNEKQIAKYNMSKLFKVKNFDNLLNCLHI